VPFEHAESAVCAMQTPYTVAWKFFVQEVYGVEIRAAFQNTFNALPTVVAMLGQADPKYDFGRLKDVSIEDLKKDLAARKALSLALWDVRRVLYCSVSGLQPSSLNLPLCHRPRHRLAFCVQVLDAVLGAMPAFVQALPPTVKKLQRDIIVEMCKFSSPHKALTCPKGQGTAQSSILGLPWVIASNNLVLRLALPWFIAVRSRGECSGASATINLLRIMSFCPRCAASPPQISTGPLAPLLPADPTKKAAAIAASTTVAKVIQNLYNLEQFQLPPKEMAMTVPLEVAVEVAQQKRAVVEKAKLDAALVHVRASLHKVEKPGIPVPPTGAVAPTKADTTRLTNALRSQTDWKLSRKPHTPSGQSAGKTFGSRF
jgi:hypothetical protein